MNGCTSIGLPEKLGLATLYVLMNCSRCFNAISLFLWLLFPLLAQAQFNYTTNQGVVIITGYTGTNGIVTIPDTIVGLPVTRIADSAFSQKSILTNVTIPDSVTNIGNSAFFNCVRMTNVAFGTNVFTIGGAAFQRCSGLTDVVLPHSVKNMGSGVFASCSNLTRINLGSNLTAIGGSAFADCSSLTNITIPKGVKSIGTEAFFRCSSLLSVIVSDTVTNIGPRAFSLCKNLGNVALGTNISIIGSYAFQSCSNLTNVQLPDSVTSIGDYAFSLCLNLAHIAIGTNTASIGFRAFQHCVSLVQLMIPASVTNIGAFAFAKCLNLAEIVVASNNPAYVSVAGVLLNASQNTLVQYPVGNSAQSYEIPNTVTNIADAAFQDCVALVSVTIPVGVTRIPNNAFCGCVGLTFISIPDHVTDVGSAAFLACSSLTNATIGNRVINIQASAFSGCSNLTSVRIGSIITTIGTEAFRDCSSLAAIYFYGDVPRNVSPNAFTNAPATAYYLPGAAHWETNLVGLPAVLWIPFTYATNNGGIIITGCTDRFLSAITISNTITGLPVVGIGDQAFDECTNLVSVAFADSVIHLGSHAFGGCTNLIDIYFDGNAPAGDVPVFADAPNATVYYRPGTTGWSSTFGGLPTALWIKFDRWVYNGVVEIGVYTDSVTDVTIPRTINGLPVTSIGLQAFRFSNITSITIPDTVTYVVDGGPFDSCGQLSSVSLPNSLTFISSSMFMYCGSLTNITIPASVNTIMPYAFYGSGLRTVYFEGNASTIYSGGYDPKNAFPGLLVTAYYLPGTTGWTQFLSQAGIRGQLWDPQIQTADGSFGVRTNQFGFNITGTSNLAVVVKSCSDLSNPVWTSLQTNTLTGVPLYFGDPHWTNYQSRFYRLHWP